MVETAQGRDDSPGFGYVQAGEEPMADEPLNLVLEHLRAVRADIAALNGKSDRLDAKFDRLDAKVDRVDRKVDSVIKQQIDMQHDVSMLRHAITPGEMEAQVRTLPSFAGMSTH
jgi:hypothetical protein